MIYFDNAATSFPKPDSVLDKIYDYQKNVCANPGRSSHELARESARTVFDTRDKLSKLFNLKNPMGVIFTKNCSEALNLCLLGYIRKKDHVITTVYEHNSVVRVLEHLKKSKDIEVTYITPKENSVVTVEDVKANIKSNTSLVVLAHADNLRGNVRDIKAIGEELKNHQNIAFAVDAAQSAGKIKIDMEDMHIDFLAMPGHKALYGPQGTGALLTNLKHPLEPMMYGGTGSYSNVITDFEQIPDMYEIGTLNGLGIAGLGAGIDFINSEGLDNIYQKEEALVNYALEKISKINGIILYTLKNEKSCGIVSFNVEGMTSSEVGAYFDSHDVSLRTGLHCNPLGHKYQRSLEEGAVRISFSYFNEKEEIDLFIQKLEDLLNERN